MSMIEGYLEAARWTETEYLLETTGRDISDLEWSPNLDLSDIADIVIPDEYPYSAEQFGHDLWLTRNGHGAGFWDRGLGKLGDELTDMAKSLGDSVMSIVDNMLILE